MFARFQRLRLWLLAWAVLSLLSGVYIARGELARQQDVFDTNARIVHRLLSQQVVEHDAILATLALLYSGSAADRPEQRLPALYRQIAAAAHRESNEAWPTPSLTAAEAQHLFDGEHLAQLLAKDTAILTPDDRAALYAYFLITTSNAAREIRQELHAARAEWNRTLDALPAISIMRELPTPKPAYVLTRGA